MPHCGRVPCQKCCGPAPICGCECCGPCSCPKAPRFWLVCADGFQTKEDLSFCTQCLPPNCEVFNGCFLASPNVIPSNPGAKCDWSSLIIEWCLDGVTGLWSGGATSVVIGDNLYPMSCPGFLDDDRCAIRIQHGAAAGPELTGFIKLNDDSCCPDCDPEPNCFRGGAVSCGPTELTEAFCCEFVNPQLSASPMGSFRGCINCDEAGIGALECCDPL